MPRAAPSSHYWWSPSLHTCISTTRLILCTWLLFFLFLHLGNHNTSNFTTTVENSSWLPFPLSIVAVRQRSSSSFVQAKDGIAKFPLHFSNFDTFPRSRHWDVACQRRFLTFAQYNRSNNMVVTPMLDIDHQLEQNRNVLSVHLSLLLEESAKRGLGSTFLDGASYFEYAVVYVPVNGSHDLSHVLTPDVTWRRVSISTTMNTHLVSRWLDIQYSRVENETLMTEWMPLLHLRYVENRTTADDGAGVVIYHDILPSLTFDDRGTFNRSECFDLDSVFFYKRAYKMQDYRIALVVHSFFFVPMVGLMLLTLCTCRGRLAKRRSPSSIIGSLSIMAVFLVSLPFINGIRYDQYKKYLRFDSKTNVWYNYIQVIVIILGLMIAVTCYIATMVCSYSCSDNCVSIQQKD